MKKTFKFETYPPIMIDYERGIENPDYDNTIRIFEVPYDWAIDWIEGICEMTYEEYMDEYTYDDTFEMYTCAIDEGVVISEKIEWRNW